MQEKTYIAIDLKSFYASVECRELGKDPLTTHLVVADPSRTEKTICLAVSPSLKAHGVPGLHGREPAERRLFRRDHGMVFRHFPRQGNHDGNLRRNVRTPWNSKK